MLEAAANLEFEKAAALRDEIAKLKKLWLICADNCDFFAKNLQNANLNTQDYRRKRGKFRSKS